MRDAKRQVAEVIAALKIRPPQWPTQSPFSPSYRPFVESTAVSFETVVPTVDEFAARIAKALAGWQWLLAERAGECVGYAYGFTHRERPRTAGRSKCPPMCIPAPPSGRGAYTVRAAAGRSCQQGLLQRVCGHHDAQ